jgi:hypothetical protein
MVSQKEFFRLVQRYVANVAIGASTLRNQGAPGVIEAARDFLASMDLCKLRRIPCAAYATELDRWTEELQHELPSGGNNWGTARKAINVFVIQASLNRFLASEYRLKRLVRVLEIPLDDQVTKWLNERAGRGILPRWLSIRSLTREVSAAYQRFATSAAEAEGLPRPYLDLGIWRAGE